MLPIDLILVRHGESEGNIADKASQKGDNVFFTPEFRKRHSREFRLTDKGIRQAKAAGKWIRENVPMPLDRFHVSDYIRAKETAYYLDLPYARWHSEFQLRERDNALMDNCPADEKKNLFALETEKFDINSFLSYPAGGGESFPQLCLRMSAGYLAQLSRKYPDRRTIAACHGHTMRALQIEIEDLGHDDFMRLDNSDNPADKIWNCQILWYTRRNPETGQVESPHITAVRSICPLEFADYGWRKINRKRYTNEELIEEVNRYPRLIEG